MTATATGFSAFLDSLNREYETLHTHKEDAFWTAYMGLSDDPDAARAELDRSEIALKQWIQDPERLAAVKAKLAEAAAASGDEAPGDAEQVALEGWRRTLQANAIEDPAARALGAELVERDGALARARGSMKLGYEHPDKGFVEASSVELGVLVANDPDPAVRRAAWQGLRSIEPHVLENGFVELVRERNRFGRMLGGEDYYDATTRRVEGMSKAEIFELLDELEEKTRDTARQAVEELRGRSGPEPVTAWNIRYLVAGDVSAELDPYFPFAESFERWGRSFAALGISYRGAELVLDLVDRKGKYENGFMHGPVPAWRRHEEWRPARIQFTANAIPGMVGSGLRATQTLFHEGGHAAHFANIDMPSPCFSQEFAPTSVAFAETQSMFLDSLLGDADWRSRYAKDAQGEPLPFSLTEKAIRSEQPFAAWNVRQWLSICYSEKSIYEIPDAELSAGRILEVIRDTERRLLFLDDGSPRPVLSVPHLLSGESSAYYHGYVLAEMAVEQTRRFFVERDGHLVDNPGIGPALREHYWQPGNSRSFRDYVRELTGRALSAGPLAARLNRSADEAVDQARAQVERLGSVPAFEGSIDLDARIRVMHGNEEVAACSAGDFPVAARDFAGWIDRQAAARA